MEKLDDIDENIREIIFSLGHDMRGWRMMRADWGRYFLVNPEVDLVYDCRTRDEKLAWKRVAWSIHSLAVSSARRFAAKAREDISARPSAALLEKIAEHAGKRVSTAQ